MASLNGMGVAKMKSHIRDVAMVIFLGLMTALPTAAQDVREATDACLSEKIETEAQLLGCVTKALAPCMLEPSDMNSSATLCFRGKIEAFEAGIKLGVSQLSDRATNEAFKLINIELKYDMLSGLLQCDRMEELAAAFSKYGAEAIQRQKAQCRATTLGLSYARLTLRAQEF